MIKIEKAEYQVLDDYLYEAIFISEFEFKVKNVEDGIYI